MRSLYTFFFLTNSCFHCNLCIMKTLLDIMVNTNVAKSPNIAVRLARLVPAFESRVFIARQAGLLFANPLLQRSTEPSRTSRCSALILKGDNDGNLSKYSKSACRVADSSGRVPCTSPGVEKSVMASMPEFLRLKGIIKNKVT